MWNNVPCGNHTWRAEKNCLVVTGTMEFYDFPDIGNHHPNWRTPSFFRGVGWNHQPEKHRWFSQQCIRCRDFRTSHIWWHQRVPSGNLLHSELENHHAFFVGKSTISTGQFSSIFQFANCKRLPEVKQFKSPSISQKIQWNPTGWGKPVMWTLVKHNHEIIPNKYSIVRYIYHKHQ